MQDKSNHADWNTPYKFTLLNTHRVGERWWGNCADTDQAFWAEPCLEMQFSFARPWLRIAIGYRLRTVDLDDIHIATVPNSWSARKLLKTVLVDIKTFPLCTYQATIDPDPFA